ncbi:hypothetical protein [Acinetobacter variabilis]|uniref:hypothetical protein n=1 Tax=Acinetobacter variabilis TaxID=70346 RepID=UPI0013302751|nr:hypothetical protein [Acinetobacter variabilis]
MTAGRPKKIIKKSDLYNFLYTQKEELFITPKYPCEINLINILENTDLTKIDFKKFTETHKNLINACQYKENQRIKNHQTLKYIKTIPFDNLTDIEKNILKKEKEYLDYNPNEYFNLQELLSNYRSHNNGKIKKCVSENTLSEYEKHLLAEKLKQRKKRNNVIFFLGASFNKIYEEFFVVYSRPVIDTLIDMMYVYFIYKSKIEHHPTLRDIFDFEKNKHLPNFSKLDETLKAISSDPRNPSLKKDLDQSLTNE